MTAEQIKEINSKCDTWYTGVFSEPNGVPIHIKEPVVYLRYEIGAATGGSCWNDNEPQYRVNVDVPKFRALDLVLELLAPDISYLNYKKIEDLIDTNEKTEFEYYGNYTDWMVKYIPVSTLEKFIETL